MLLEELFAELHKFSPDTEVRIEVKGWEADIKGVFQDTDETSSRIILSDYPDK